MFNWQESEDKSELEEYAKEQFGVDLDKRKGLNKLKAEIAEHHRVKAEAQGDNDAVREIEEKEQQGPEKAEVKPDHEWEGEYSEVTIMNTHALKIWQGQSVSLPKHERVRRIKAALVKKGYTDILDKLELPE